jgi:pantetheine-phosphate adenylyltransferase
MPERIGVYPGSFDPPTFGHLDMIRRAAKLFDLLIVAVARNTDKHGMFMTDERKEMLREITKDIPNVRIDHFSGLTVDFARDNGAHALVRGLRAISDFEYELAMAATNRKLRPDCDTLILMPSEEYMFISSRLVKEIAMLGGDVSPFLPPTVLKRLKTKLNRE